MRNWGRNKIPARIRSSFRGSVHLLQFVVLDRCCVGGVALELATLIFVFLCPAMAAFYDFYN
jgi:hypothetical protein